MISYYDLIELIGKHEEPKYVYYHFPSRKVKYEAIYDGNTFREDLLDILKEVE